MVSLRGANFLPLAMVHLGRKRRCIAMDAPERCSVGRRAHCCSFRRFVAMERCFRAKCTEWRANTKGRKLGSRGKKIYGFSLKES